MQMKPIVPLLSLLLLAGGGWVWLGTSGDDPSSRDADEEVLEPRLGEETTSGREVIPSPTTAPDRESTRIAASTNSRPADQVTRTEGTPAFDTEALNALRAENLKERRVRMAAEIQSRSIRIADELGLGTGAEQSIAKVYLDQEARIQSIRDEYAKGAPTREARTRLREELDGIKAWRKERFTTLFGNESAAAIEGFQDRAALEASNLKREDTE